ncbi:signal peptidase I, partial [Bacillus anthracis]
QELLFVSKLLHTFSEEPKYGDIIILDSQLGEEETFLHQILQVGFLAMFQDDVY